MNEWQRLVVSVLAASAFALLLIFIVAGIQSH